MSQEASGPAARTHSRKNSELTKADPPVLDPPAPGPHHRQSLVSDFLLQNRRINECVSDSEVLNVASKDNRLAKRSKSGKIYQSTLTIGSKVNKVSYNSRDKTRLTTNQLSIITTKTNDTDNSSEYNSASESLVMHNMNSEENVAAASPQNNTTTTTKELSAALGDVNAITPLPPFMQGADVSIAITACHSFHPNASIPTYSQARLHPQTNTAVVYSTTGIKPASFPGAFSLPSTGRNMVPAMSASAPPTSATPDVEDPMMKLLQTINSKLTTIQTDITTLKDNKDQTNSTTMSASAPPTSATPDVEDPMMKLLQTINSKLTTIQTDITTLKDNKDQTNSRLDGLEFELEDQQEDLTVQKVELRECQDQVKLLSNIVANYEECFQDLNTKMLQLEAKAMKTELIIFGIQQTAETTLIQHAKSFFLQKLKIKEEEIPGITYAYWKDGSSKGYPPLVVKLCKASDKGVIFSHATNLKGQTNLEKKPYRVSDHLPEELADEKLRIRQILNANKQLEGSKMQMEIKKGKLYVEGVLYKRKVTCPSAKKLLQMHPEENKQVESWELADGGSKSDSGNKFHAYAVNASTLGEVRNSYLHVKKMHGDANHVSMAYRLAGLNKAYDEDYYNDREHGSGHRLLSLLTQNDSVNCAIFVVRYYSGIHIGGRRFAIHNSLASTAIEKLKKGDTYTSRLPLKQLQNSSPKPRKQKGRPHKAMRPIRAGHNVSSWANREIAPTHNPFSYLDRLSTGALDSSSPVTNFSQGESNAEVQTQ